MRRAMHFSVSRCLKFPHSSVQPSVGHIYCHKQINCFVVSQLFTVSRLVRCFKLISKPADFTSEPSTFSALAKEFLADTFFNIYVIG